MEERDGDIIFLEIWCSFVESKADEKVLSVLQRELQTVDAASCILSSPRTGDTW